MPALRTAVQVNLVATFAMLLSGAACAPGEGVVDVASLGPVGAEALSAVQIAFPEQSPSMLLGLGGFVAAEEASGSKGFRLEEPSGRELPTSAWLPQRAGEPMRLSFRDGFELQVREQGVEGEGKLTGGVVSYRRAEGTAFWHGSAAGAEEWLYLPEGSATVEVATWDVEGGTLRQHGRAVDVYDAEGKPRVTVAAPAGYAADGSDVPLRLVVRGDSIVLTIEAPTREALLLDPVWVSAGSMATASSRHKATLLPSGRVLVAGGDINFGTSVLKRAELYDPVTGTWAPASSMTHARTYFSATLMPTGMVVAVGGLQPIASKSAEAYDDSSDVWTLTPPLNQDHSAHVATLLLDGRLLIAGGYLGAEIYDSVANTWTVAAVPTYVKGTGACAILTGGDVLVACGVPNGKDSEIYHPGADSWTPTSPMNIDRDLCLAFTLPTGHAIYFGGYNGSGKTAVEIYDEAMDTWTLASPMTYGRYGHAGVLLPVGRIMAIAGQGGLNGLGSSPLGTTEIYDPAMNTWTPGPSLVGARTNPSATLLPNGKILVAGGSNNGTDLATAEILSDSGATSPGGAFCLWDNDCASLHCADGVCCDSACNAGPCDACTTFLGASADGICTPLSGAACDDGDACTQSDSCLAGACIGASPVVCPVPAECHQPGLCDPATAVCSSDVVSDGTPCSVGTCQAGVCTPSMGQGGGGGADGTGGASTGMGGNGGFGGAGLGGAGGYGGAGMGGSGGVGGVGIGGAGGFGGAAEGTGGRETSQGGGGEAVSSTTGSVTGAGGSTSGGGATSSGEEAAVDSGGCSCRTAPSRSGGTQALAGLVAAAAFVLRRRERSSGKPKRGGGLWPPRGVTRPPHD